MSKDQNQFLPQRAENLNKSTASMWETERNRDILTNRSRSHRVLAAFMLFKVRQLRDH